MHAGQAEYQHDAYRSNYCIYHRYLKAQRWKATGQKGRDCAASGGKLQGPWGGFSSLAPLYEGDLWEQSLLAMTSSPTTSVLAKKMLSRASFAPTGSLHREAMK
ncbi:hypothetical protein PBDP_3992 [Pseudomonas sp. St290]|nr:hypothetical protein PBDP_3992 [Pseudomonas sp. St290]